MRRAAGIIFTIFLSAGILYACRLESNIQPNTLAEATRPSLEETAVPDAPVPTPSKTARTQLDLSGHALSFNGAACPLKEVDFYNLYMFQAACEQQVYLPQGGAITITFETLDGQSLPISAVDDLEGIFGGLEPPFVFCEFGGADATNTVTFGVPFQQTTGRDILCAFSAPLQGEDVIIALTGLTTR